MEENILNYKGHNFKIKVPPTIISKQMRYSLYACTRCNMIGLVDEIVNEIVLSRKEERDDSFLSCNEYLAKEVMK